MRLRQSRARIGAHQIQTELYLLPRDLLGRGRALRAPPRRQRGAHGDDGAGAFVGVVGAEPTLAHRVCDLLVHQVVSGTGAPVNPIAVR